MKTKILCFATAAILSIQVYSQQVYNMSSFGIRPGNRKDMSAKINKALVKIKSMTTNEDSIVLRFEKGCYNFHPEKAVKKAYYISNHDQTGSKCIGMALEGFQHVTIEGNGAEFVFHGQMLPLSVVNTLGCTLKDFSIDFVNPHIAQVRIVKNEGNNGITFEPEEWVKCRITKDSIFETYGKGWRQRPHTGIAFEKDTRHVVYQTSDLYYSTKGVYKTENNTYHAPLWRDKRMKEGTVVAMRTWERPAPGIFISNSKNISLLNVKVHYAQGMGLLAQMSENITLNGFCVCLKGEDDRRYFTTQADATHFSGCKGKIVSVNGLYEGMMDDAINVHGTYLKVMKRTGRNKLIGRYMHEQSWGFDWGYKGDTVQFVRSKTMEHLPDTNIISAITPVNVNKNRGVKEFEICFEHELPAELNSGDSFGIENLTWTPEVLFAGNTIRNNRARGSLFSTPKRTVVENNLFDHTSGTAILLCGDCNGWYETGACRDVTIRNNKFINALTNMFQFTNAVISIYPEIPNLKEQTLYFHGGKPGAIRIENNEFHTFDAPLLYAKSVDGLVFRNNTIHHNNDYPPFHWNKSRFLLEKVNRVEIE